MTLQDIITQALRRMGRSTDASTLNKYQPSFLFSINEGVKLIAQRYRQTKKQTVALTDSTFANTLLTYRVYEITSVLAADEAVDFAETYAGSGVFEVDTEETSVDVIYRFVPADLSNSIDEPDIPEEYHGMLVNYVVGNERANGDPSLQNTASYDLQTFNAKLQSIVPCDVPTKLTGYYT